MIIVIIEDNRAKPFIFNKLGMQYEEFDYKILYAGESLEELQEKLES